MDYKFLSSMFQDDVLAHRQVFSQVTHSVLSVFAKNFNHGKFPFNCYQVRASEETNKRVRRLKSYRVEWRSLRID